MKENEQKCSSVREKNVQKSLRHFVLFVKVGVSMDLLDEMVQTHLYRPAVVSMDQNYVSVSAVGVSPRCGETGP